MGRSCGGHRAFLIYVGKTGPKPFSSSSADTYFPVAVLWVKRADTTEQVTQLRRDAAPEWDESLPVLNPALFMELTDEAGETAARRFFAEYLDLLPSRVARVIRGLSSSDAEVSRGAVVSLRVTSAMAGAVRMEHYCRELEDRLGARMMPDAAGVLSGMSRASKMILQEGAHLACTEVSP